MRNIFLFDTCLPVALKLNIGRSFNQFFISNLFEIEIRMKLRGYDVYVAIHSRHPRLKVKFIIISRVLNLAV